MAYFIGGTAPEDDIAKLENCHIAVGAPGRVRALLRHKKLKTDSIKLFVLDEADQLMNESFYFDINYIFYKLPERKQFIASSATYPDKLDVFLTNYMNSPTIISPNTELPLLLGIQQYVHVVKSHLNVMQQMKIKIEELEGLLKTVKFTQCIIFSNYQIRAETISKVLNRSGWSTVYFSGAQDQAKRLQAVGNLKDFKCRILSTTDLAARGIDAANVDFIINYEVPYNTETYLHRMGRAGRYGSKGICITLAGEGIELEKLQKILGKIRGTSFSIPKYPKDNMPENIWKCDVEQFEKVFGIVEQNVHVDSDMICDTLSELSVEQEIDTGCKKNETVNQGNAVVIKNLQYLENAINKNDELSQKDVIIKDTDTSDLFNEIQGDKLNKIEIKSSLDVVEVDVANILNDLSKQDLENQHNIKSKLNIEDAASILNMLTKKTEDSNNTSSDKSSNTSTDSGVIPKSKKAKKRNNKKCIASINTNCDFEQKATLFQQNTILQKNLALLNIAKLSMQHEKVNEENVNSTATLLDILIEEDKPKITDPDSLQKLVQLLNPHMEKNANTSTKIEDPGTNLAWVHVTDIEERNETTLCDCYMNIFNKVFDYAISKTDECWSLSICSSHFDVPYKSKVKEINLLVEENNHYDQEYYETDDEYYQQHMEYEDVVIEDKNSIKMNSNIFESTSSFRQNIHEPSQNVEATEDEIENDGNVCGYAIDASFEDLNQTDNEVDKDKQTNNTKYETLYESYFDFYNKLLAQYAFHFTDEQVFDEWFNEWHTNLMSTRQHVQEDIYSRSMNDLHNSSEEHTSD